MDWLRLSTTYYLDPALLRAGEAAELLYLRILAYCGSVESGGRVPRAALPMLCPAVRRTSAGRPQDVPPDVPVEARADALVREGLLVEEGEDLLVRSWAQWQEALDREVERRRADRERKRRARAQSTTASRRTSTGRPADNPPDLSAGRPQDVRRKSARKEETREEENKSVVAPAQSRRKTPPSPPPETFPLTDAMKAWGREHAPLVRNPLEETARFLDHARATAKTHSDWVAAWRNWMRKAQEFAERDGALPPAAAATLDPHKEYLRGVR